MSHRSLLRRWLPAVAAAISLTAAMPALASAQQSIAIGTCASCTPSSSSGFQAGGDSSYTTTIALDTAKGAPQTLSTQLASGLLANLSSNTALGCLTVPAGTDYPLCQVGGGTITSTAGTFSFTAYVVAPSAGNVMGVDFAVATSPSSVLHGEISLQQLSSGPVVATQTTPLSGLPAADANVTNLTFNVNGTLPDGSPLTRMPSACTPASPTSLTVIYALGTETTNASPDVDVSSTCGSLPFAPTLTGAAVRDSGDQGTQITADLSQTGTQAAIASATLLLPSNVLGFNPTAANLANTATPVGTVTALSPLLPSSIPLTGSVYLTVSSSGSLGLILYFTSPLPIAIQGAVGLAGSVAFSGAPDLPLSDLKVTLNGGPNAVFNAPCAASSGTLSASVTGQNDASAGVATPLTIANCSSTTTPTTTTTTPVVGKPAGLTLSGVSLTGLRKRRPGLRFTLTRGTSALNIRSVSVGPPSGLSFNRKAIHKTSTCTGKGKKRRCTTTLKVKGLTLSGAKLKGAKLSGGRLVLTFKKAAASVSASANSTLLSESKSLQKQVKNGKLKSLRLTVGATDTSHATTMLVASVKP